MEKTGSRRRFLRCSLAASGFAAALSLEERVLLAEEKQREVGGAEAIEPSADTLPVGRIRHVEMTRLILGGNLIAGIAHARDLRYVSQLLREYFTDEKIIRTWQLAEEHGINTMSAWPTTRNVALIERYRRLGGKLQWLGHANCEKPYTGIKTCIDHGAAGVYVSGDRADQCARDGRVRELGEPISLIKQNGLIAGVAGHPLDVPRACEEAGIDADFYMQTLHSGDYWSATPPKQHESEVGTGESTVVVGNYASGFNDNIWCLQPDETIAYLKTVTKPWMAFKVLAAGAIHPRQGFAYAFRSGADFVHVGMFDFQIAEDCEIARRLLARNLRRQRPWRA